MESEGLLGLAGYQHSSSFSGRPCFQEISQKVVEQELWQPPLVLLYESMHLHAYYNIHVHVYTHARAYTHIPQLFVKIVSDGSDG